MNSNPYIFLDENSLKKLSNLHPLFFYGFSIKILPCTHILPMPQLRANQLMTSRHQLFTSLNTLCMTSGHAHSI